VHERQLASPRLVPSAVPQLIARRSVPVLCNVCQLPAKNRPSASAGGPLVRLAPIADEGGCAFGQDAAQSWCRSIGEKPLAAGNTKVATGESVIAMFPCYLARLRSDGSPKRRMICGRSAMAARLSAFSFFFLRPGSRERGTPRETWSRAICLYSTGPWAWYHLQVHRRFAWRTPPY
jgi:hypothetical protein